MSEQSRAGWWAIRNAAAIGMITGWWVAEGAARWEPLLMPTLRVALSLGQYRAYAGGTWWRYTPRLYT